MHEISCREKSLEKDALELRECTFHPRTNSLRPSTERHSCISRNEILYGLARRELRLDRPTIEVEYEKNFDELTFTPNLASSKKSAHLSRKLHLSNNRNFTKAVLRLRRANAERETQRLLQDRSMPISARPRLTMNTEGPEYTSFAPTPRML
eukprot:TRINITY_DN3507_c0_g1_i6.p1 TRINITY_DN3507_c0_g1~~TRINITY_DN3507_c0_g1_i6.p1  ORF type:complete len:152 (-),score=39.92 TRINITY_DN3507_c0_g1_i6:107-562(-)